MDIFELYLSTVAENLKSATPREIREVKAELRAHLEDHASALTEVGRTEEEARERAVESMGDASQVGKALNKEFPYAWLIVSRAAALLAVVLAFMLLSNVRSSLYILKNSLNARNNPTYFEEYDNLIDCCCEIPKTNDVLYLYGCDIAYDSSSGYIANIGLCCYDKNIFADVSHFSSNLRFYSYDTVLETYRNDIAVGGGGFSTYGVHHRSIKVPISKGQESVLAIYEHFGTKLEIEIPLNWEGIE